MARFICVLVCFCAVELMGGETSKEITPEQRAWFYEYIKRGNQAKLEELVAANPAYLKLRYDSFQKYTVLQAAVFEQKLEIVRWLIDVQKCDVNELNAQNETALRISAFRDNRELSMLLIEKGARGDLGDNPAYEYLIGKGHRAAIDTLLSKKLIDIKARCRLGRTILYNAAMAHNVELCDLLLKSGADPNVIEKSGYSILHQVSAGHTDPVARDQRLACAKLLLARNVNLNVVNDKGHSVLHLASDGNPEMLELLLNRGMNINSADKEGYTPLHFAAYYGSGECVKLLLKRGADPKLKNINRNTPYHLAKGEAVKAFQDLGFKK